MMIDYGCYEDLEKIANNNQMKIEIERKNGEPYVHIHNHNRTYSYEMVTGLGLYHKIGYKIQKEMKPEQFEWSNKSRKYNEI